jgi:contractile injection system tube protein
MASNGLTKAVLSQEEPKDSSKDIKFLFNPENCTVKGGAKWTLEPTKAAKHSAPPHYGGAQNVNLSMSVLFDESLDASGDVSKYVEQMLEWTRPTPDTLQKGKVPAGPVLGFAWGSNKTFNEFKCVLTSVSAQYTMFRPDGTPTRAMVSLTLDQVPKDFKRQNPTSGAIQGRSSRLVGDGDSLHSIAFQEYGDPTLWRALALFNEVDDPLRVPPGTSLLIPTPGEAQQIVKGEVE